jgi:phenylalanyl-tRNA synthetase alpha chain
MAVDLSNPEKRLLKVMQSDSERVWNVSDLCKATGFNDQAIVVGAGQGLVENGMAEGLETQQIFWKLGKEGIKANSDGLLEIKLWDWVLSSKDTSMKSLQTSSIVEKHEIGIGVGLLKSLGISLENGCFTIPEDKEEINSKLNDRMNFLKIINSSEKGVSDKELDAELLNHFKNRKNLLASIEELTRTWNITNEGMKIKAEDLEEKTMIAEITPELLQGDSWQDAEFKPYDVSLKSATPLAGKPHPMQSLIERIRSIFLEMGFTEIEGDYVQTAGWNMDALFIPQDHPAREMQDTFYLSKPESIPIDDEILNQWKSIHEHGGDTGSIGWGGEFSKDIAQRGLLRTHTTVNTVKYISENPNEPCRVFGIGRVFRNESIDRTHLPEFHQIEGIIMEPGANLPMLVTTLKTFYEKMGYPEVRVRPAYFPYTEPSLEVEVKWRGQWLELGGAGIFRPEVTEPLGCSAPVLAWGMGLERLAMLVLGLDDIRQLYISDLEWLKSQPVL